MSVKFWDGLKVWWWAFSRTLYNSDKESFVNTLLVTSTLARWPELSKQETATLKGVILVILYCKYVKEHKKIQVPQLEFWIIPIYPSIPLDGAKVDLSTTISKQQGCTFSNKIQTSAHKTNWGIRSNAEHLCRTPHKLVLWKSSTLFCQGMCFDECQQKIDLLSFWGQQERSGTEQIRYSFINSGLRKPRISAVFSEWANHKICSELQGGFQQPRIKTPRPAEPQS